MTGRTVIIVHPSELVGRGLAAVLEGLQGVRVLCFSSYPEIRIVEHATAEKLLLFVPVACRYADELLALRTRIGKHRLVGLLSGEPETNENERFDQVLAIDAPATEFYSVAQRFFRHDETVHDDELTNREREVLRLIALGLTNKQMADSLFISAHTIISHRKHITEKLGIKSIPGLTVYAIIKKIIDTSDISADQLL